MDGGMADLPDYGGLWPFALVGFLIQTTWVVAGLSLLLALVWTTWKRMHYKDNHGPQE